MRGAGLEIRCVFPAERASRSSCLTRSFTTCSPVGSHGVGIPTENSTYAPGSMVRASRDDAEDDRCGREVGEPGDRQSEDRRLAPDSGTDVRSREAVFRVDGLVGHVQRQALALGGVTLDVHKNAVTAFIGPSGCGKSTFIRCLNRMNDLIPGAKVDGEHPLSRARPLRLERRPGRGAPADRDGLPEAKPVPEVDLRQRRVRSAHARHEEGPRRARRARRCATRRSGTRSRTG